jgi:hypothetical protein
MKAKKILKWGCGIAAVILAALLLLIGSFIYVARYRITEIDAATSPDGTYEIVFQAVGEPDWPFGYSHARIVLKRNGETVTKHKFDVANDGGVLHPENWSVRWEENCVKVMISGEEQPDAFYTYYFDGTVRHESLAVQELDNREAVSPEMMFDEPTTDFSDLVAENEKGESVFAIPIENFIDCYNRVYLQTHETGYLNSTNSENWYCCDELSPCFGYASVRYKFSADKTVWPMPTISVYAPDNDEIYEIRMVFDDHGYQDRFHELFRELCICMEKMMMPELSMAEAETLFETLYAQSNDNFFGDHSAFDDPERPLLNAVYQYKNIGMYCFYGSGNIEICFVPLTAHAVGFLEENGIPLLDWKDSD